MSRPDHSRIKPVHRSAPTPACSELLTLAMTHPRTFRVHALAARKLTFYCEEQGRPDSGVAPLTRGDW